MAEPVAEYTIRVRCKEPVGTQSDLLRVVDHHGGILKDFRLNRTLPGGPWWFVRLTSPSYVGPVLRQLQTLGVTAMSAKKDLACIIPRIPRNFLTNTRIPCYASRNPTQLHTYTHCIRIPRIPCHASGSFIRAHIMSGTRTNRGRNGHSILRLIPWSSSRSSRWHAVTLDVVLQDLERLAQRWHHPRQCRAGDRQ